MPENEENGSCLMSYAMLSALCGVVFVIPLALSRLATYDL
jgi:hypothetical protein